MEGRWGLPGLSEAEALSARSCESTEKSSCQSAGACEGRRAAVSVPAASLRLLETPLSLPPRGLTASGRSNLARRKVSGLGPAGSARLSAAIASGSAPAAPARSARCRRRPMRPAPTSLDRAPPPAGPRVQSPRRCRLCCARTQSPRGPGHAPTPANERCTRPQSRPRCRLWRHFRSSGAQSALTAPRAQPSTAQSDRSLRRHRTPLVQTCPLHRMAA